MKGQSNVEYLMSMIIFVTIVIYISFQVSNTVPYYHVNSLNNRFHSECLRLSEGMLKGSALQHEFSKEPYDLNLTKLNDFDTLCNPHNEIVYEGLIEDFGLESERDFQIRVNVDGGISFTCGREIISSQSIVATIERYAVTEGNSTSITVSIW